MPVFPTYYSGKSVNVLGSVSRGFKVVGAWCLHSRGVVTQCPGSVSWPGWHCTPSGVHYAMESLEQHQSRCSAQSGGLQHRTLAGISMDCVLFCELYAHTMSCTYKGLYCTLTHFCIVLSQAFIVLARPTLYTYMIIAVAMFRTLTCTLRRRLNHT